MEYKFPVTLYHEHAAFADFFPADNVGCVEI